MKYTKVFALYERTYNVRNYQSVKLSTSLSAELEEGDDPLESQNEVIIRCAAAVESYAEDQGFAGCVPQPQPGRYGVPIKRQDYEYGKPVNDPYDV